jgi:hypothetical protein
LSRPRDRTGCRAVGYLERTEDPVVHLTNLGATLPGVARDVP